MKETKVISAFPACGKTYMYKNNKDLIILDSDSSEFSWIKDENGNNTKKRNPSFPENYIDHIESNLGKVDIIFVSSHDVVRKALYDNTIYYTLVYPDKSLKDEWIQRFKDRGNNEGFIDFVSSNWDNFIEDIEQEAFPTLLRLESGEFISDKDVDYREINIGIGSTVEEAVNRLKFMDFQGQKVYIDFNGHRLYSDKVTMDSAYMMVTGKTKAEIDADQKKWHEEYDRQKQEHKDAIPSLIAEYISAARGVIRDDKLELWDEIVPIRLDDLYQGMELQNTIELAELLNDKKFDEAKEALSKQGHSGMSYGLVKSMINEFCNNGKEFLGMLN